MFQRCSLTLIQPRRFSGSVESSLTSVFTTTFLLGRIRLAESWHRGFAIKGVEQPRHVVNVLTPFLIQRPILWCVTEMGVDRTSEFHAAVHSISQRASKSPLESRRLLSSSSSFNSNASQTKPTPKSQFSRMASKIGHDIASTSAKLQRLAQCTPSPSSGLTYFCSG